MGMGGIKIVLGPKPKSGAMPEESEEMEEEESGMSDEAGKLAAGDLISAIKKGDAAAVWSAYQALRDC